MHLHRPVFLFATLILAAACGGDSSTGPKPPALPSDRPTDTPFALPAGVTTVGVFKGPDAGCDSATRVGFSAQLVEVCVTLHNSATSVDNAGLREIVNILANKAIDESSVWEVQDAIWKVSHDDGLTSETRSALNALPSR